MAFAEYLKYFKCPGHQEFFRQPFKATIVIIQWDSEELQKKKSGGQLYCGISNIPCYPLHERSSSPKTVLPVLWVSLSLLHLPGDIGVQTQPLVLATWTLWVGVHELDTLLVWSLFSIKLIP